MDQPIEHSSESPRRSFEAKRSVEGFLGVVIAFLLLVAAVPGIKPIELTVLDDPTVRGLEGLLLLARDEAIETGEDHIVFFQVQRNSVPSISGEPANVMAWLIRDRDGNGRASTSEYVASVPVDAHKSVAWGSAFATHPAIGDVAVNLEGPLSFAWLESGAHPPGLLFRKDGAPAATGLPAAAQGEPGSGAGTVYLQSASRDYAVVLSPWGDIEVQVWDGASTSWKIASTH